MGNRTFPVASYSPQHLQYGCYNAAVTAWHLADWVYADATVEQRAVLNIKTLGDLQEKARSQCRELYLCYFLANASKHREVKFHIDRTVDAGVQSGMDSSDSIRTWEAFVDDGDTKRPAIDIFVFAMSWWTGIIYQNKIASGDE